MDLMETIRAVAPIAAEHTARHDREGTFVVEAMTALRDAGYLATPAPTDLGGAGATVRQVAEAQAELARSCPSTALASSMHLHVVLASAWRYRRGDDAVAGMLKRVAAEHLVVASTGGGDLTRPTADATPVDGGWRISGRKRFVSGAPLAQVASTWATTPEGEAIGFGLPLSADGVTLEETWDAHGMRGTASHDLVLDDVFVTDAQVNARRRLDVFQPVLSVIATNAFPVITAVYVGTARALRDAVVATARHDRPLGLVEQHLLTAEALLERMLVVADGDPDPSEAVFAEIMLAKKAVNDQLQALVAAAWDAVGGAGFAAGSALDRGARDLRAASLHPIDPEATLLLAGGQAKRAASAAA